MSLPQSTSKSIETVEQFFNRIAKKLEPGDARILLGIVDKMKEPIKSEDQAWLQVGRAIGGAIRQEVVRAVERVRPDVSVRYTGLPPAAPISGDFITGMVVGELIGVATGG